MLHKETVDPGTLELLIDLTNDSLLEIFFLVEGTALALQIGHRKSIDLDFFILNDYDEETTLSTIEDKYGFYLNYQSKNILKGQIAGVKVDFITHKYPLINSLIYAPGIRMASMADIAAMKINAIVGNGTRLKDFIDVAYLSIYFTLSEIIEAYQKKYSTRNPLVAIKAISYYADINFNEPVDIIDEKYSWPVIEKRLNNLFKTPDKLLGPLKF